MSKPKWLGSSVNPDKISLTLKSLVPLAVFLLSWLKLDITETEIEETLTLVGVIASACVTLFGLARKFRVKK